jgi:asparagine synthase (glutamine-hydrolysing)
MCGIAGYFGALSIPEGRIQTCLRLMGRREPDRADHRHFTNSASRNLYMLFSHLAIIDLDKRADQPFSSENK